MDIEPWLQLVQQGGMAATIAAFLAGLLFSVNPVAMAAVPVALAYVTKARETRQAVMYGAMFVLGMLVTHVALGFLAGLGGSWVQGLLGRFWGLLLGPILILLGLVWTGWVRLPLPAIAARARRPQGLWGAFGLAVPFSIAICPVCTPILVVLLGVGQRLAPPAWVLCCCSHLRLDGQCPSSLAAWPSVGSKACAFLRHTAAPLSLSAD